MGLLPLILSLIFSSSDPFPRISPCQQRPSIPSLTPQFERILIYRFRSQERGEIVFMGGNISILA
ncbi:hypothetical protein DAI22_03g335800 [Oryza sativa Japonica Group]|nr:hypothetical protein DAI22_03g335800 [Oryza sativa Japonica Group]